MATVLPSQQRHINGRAVASLVFALVWFLGIGSIVAIVLGLSARRQIHAGNGRGEGLAVAGIAVGAVGLLLGIFFVLGVAFSSGSGHTTVG